MKTLSLISLAGCFFIASCANEEKQFVDENIKFAAQQTELMLKQANELQGKYPRTTNKEGRMVGTNMYDWTSGFFPGTLWYLYELTGEPQWKDEATQWTHTLKPLKTFTKHHDLGFMMYCSYGNEYRLAPTEEVKQILIESAESLCTRFSPATGTIKSWDSGRSWNDTVEWTYPVIIDNMMNLEMLFFASKVSGNSKYHDIAVTHANTTLKNHLRPDYSTYHVVDYDTLTGAVRNQVTAQGYSDNSTWARGQAWGIYGYTMTYRETQDPVYLEAAKKMTDFYLHHANLPADKVPYWDFNAGQEGYKPEIKSKANLITGPYRDASAAAIVASALFELSELAQNKEYLQAAIDILHALASPAYRAPVGENGNFILMHCVGSIPHGGEIDVPLVYADYYFMEAMQRYKKHLNK